MTLGRVAEGKGDYPLALARSERALEISRQVDDKRLEAIWLTNVAIAYGRLRNHTESEKRLKQALTIHRESGDRLNQAVTLGNLGFKAQLTGNLDDAEQRYRAALDIYRAVGSDFQADMLNNLGIVATERGAYTLAIQYFDHAINIFRETGDRALLIEASNCQTHVLLIQDNVAPALTNLRESLVLLANIDSKPMTLMTLMQVAHLHFYRGEYRDAVSLITFIEAQPETGIDFASLHSE